MNAIYIKIYYFISLILKRVLVLAEIFLFLRLVLKFLGANPQAFVIKYFYEFTGVIVWPFSGIFPNIWLLERLIEIVTLSAIVGYAIAVFIVLKTLKLMVKQ